MFNKGDVAVCKENEKGNLSITIGKGYQVLSATKVWVEITNDIGVTQQYLVERFQAPSSVKMIKLEVGKTYLTAGGYVVHITAMHPGSIQYYTTIECSPGVNAGGDTIQKVSSDRTTDYKKYGWQYQSDGTIYLGISNEWTEKLRITEEFSKLKPAPSGFRYAGGFPQARPPKKGDWYMSCFSGDAIQADKDESKTLIRIIIEKEKSKMPPFQSLPAGFKFASVTPEYRMPKTGEWFIGIDGHARQAESDFQSSPYYIISKISETPKEEVYPKYYEMSGPNKNDYAFRKRVSETKHRLVSHSGKESHEFYWISRDKSIGDIELTEEVALGRINKPVAQTTAPPKITNLCVEVHNTENNVPSASKEYVLASDAFTTSPIPKKSMLSYWIAEPIENIFDTAKKSARYVVASSLLVGIGYVSFNPVESFNFVSSCLPKIHIKFGK